MSVYTIQPGVFSKLDICDLNKIPDKEIHIHVSFFGSFIGSCTNKRCDIKFYVFVTATKQIVVVSNRAREYMSYAERIVNVFRNEQDMLNFTKNSLSSNWSEEIVVIYRSAMQLPVCDFIL